VGKASGSARIVNDVHSQLNATKVREVVRPESIQDLRAAVAAAHGEGRSVSIAGSRHAMGGQQFASDATLLDTRALNRVLALDKESGLVTVESGIAWHALIDWLVRSQSKPGPTWGIRQKQTGADALTVGGALAANAHGRGLSMKPLIEDVEAIEFVSPDGRVRTCSRRENRELFGLAIGGYGLFGVIASVTLRLAPRRKLMRVVEEEDADALAAAFEQRIAGGALYGDFQFTTDENSDKFLTSGILSCYEPVTDATPIPDEQRELTVADWRQLLYLAHTDKQEAYRRYRAHYVSTSGQIYWSDTHQLGLYLPGYHAELDRALGPPVSGSEMIGELYVPRERLADFLAGAATALRAHQANVIYGTVRLIEEDDESFLSWARQAYACVVINLHVDHTAADIERCGEAFRALIDLALDWDGSYFLTYHRWATREQVEACYPQFSDFLLAKLRHDPQETFQSEWYRYYRGLFAEPLS
jgi:FAD/FMN-containing dehydrogenase